MAIEPPDAYDGLAAWLRVRCRKRSARSRAAVLVVSAHWEEDEPTVMTNPRPSLLYDYYGFPPETYRLRYDAPGSPALARACAQLLRDAGIACRDDGERGYDHGVFVPMMLAYPAADVPIVQLSIRTRPRSARAHRDRTRARAAARRGRAHRRKRDDVSQPACVRRSGSRALRAVRRVARRHRGGQRGRGTRARDSSAGARRRRRVPRIRARITSSRSWSPSAPQKKIPAEQPSGA